MTETANLGLPLLSPSQAQKHVTVNEALGRIDAAAQLSVLSRSVSTPPGTAAEGDAYLVPVGAVNAWAGQAGRIAFYQNGGWVFLTPRAGWRGFVTTTSETLLFDGSDWAVNAVAVAPGGSALSFAVREFDHALGAGATSLTAAEIPDNTVVFGVTGRVLSDITGTLATFRVGVTGSDNRYGSGIGTAQGSWLRGLTGTPLAYYAPTELLLTAEGGTFGGAGTVRLAIHYGAIGLPSLV